jgi:hypothetical protein
MASLKVDAIGNPLSDEVCSLTTFASQITTMTTATITWTIGGTTLATSQPVKFTRTGNTVSITGTGVVSGTAPSGSNFIAGTVTGTITPFRPASTQSVPIVVKNNAAWTTGTLSIVGSTFEIGASAVPPPMVIFTPSAACGFILNCSYSIA